MSLAWSCRDEAKHLSACMSKYTGRIGELKQRWHAAGAKHAMTEAEWSCLLDELLDDK